MQLCRCINCFLKPHNKQLNQYCLNFTIFFTPKKKSFKKMVWVRVGLTRKNTGQPIFASGQKNRVRVRYFSGRVGSENSDPFCHVYPPREPRPTLQLLEISKVTYSFNKERVEIKKKNLKRPCQCIYI